MNIELNVSLNGNHLFATHERSLTSSEEAQRLIALFKVKFPESDGYKISGSIDLNRRYGVDLDNVKESVNEAYERS